VIRKYFSLPRTVYLLCLGTLVNRAGSFIAPMLTLYLHERLGMSARFATMALGLCGLGSLVAGLVGGHLADRFGRRRVMLMALCGSATMMLVLGSVRSPAAILVCAAGMMLCADLYRPASSAAIADMVDPSMRPSAYGLMYLAINLGFSIGAFAAGQLFAHIPIYWLFAADAATTLTYAAIIYTFIPETLARATPAAGAHAAEGSLAPGLPAVGWTEAFGQILRDRSFMRFCGSSLLVALVFMQAMSTLPLFMETRHMGADDYGALIALNGVLIVLLQIPTAAVVTRFDRGTMVSLAAVMTGIGFGMHMIADRAWMFAAAIAVWTLGEMMFSPLTPAIVADLAPVHLRGRYMGVWGTSYAGANMIGAPFGGLVLEKWGGRVLWTSCMVLCTISAVGYASLRRQIAARNEAS